MEIIKKYTKTEQQILDLSPNMAEIPDYQIEDFAEALEYSKKMWYAIELGRCPSTDKRTYILHTWIGKPNIDYYGAEKVKLKG